METKNKTLQRMLFNKIIDKNIKTLKSSIALNNKNHLNNAFIGYLMISVSLIMILTAVEEIFPQICNKNKKNTLIGILSGIIIFILNIIIIS